MVMKSEATYRDLEDELLVVVLELEGVQNGRELGGIEFHCACCQSTVIGARESFQSHGGDVD